MPLNKQQLGQRLALLRKSRQYSQEELAGLIGMQRSTLTQIELGNRNVSALELADFAHTLGVTVDLILGEEFNLIDSIVLSDNPEEKTERIAIPRLNKEKFVQVLLYVLEQCAGRPNVGETVLYKLLYFIDFNYFERYEDHLIGATFRKLPYGPVPYKLDRILVSMQEKALLKLVKTEYHGYTQKRYLPLKKPDLTKLKASEKEVMDQVIVQFGDYSASAISDYSHQDMPWKATKEGEVIDYELVFYREPPFSVRNYSEEEDEIS